MPRYFIDTDDGDMHARDDVGADFDGPESARHAALDALPSMARDKIPNGDHRIFASSVRDESGLIVYRATLTLDAQWNDGQTSGIQTVVSRDIQGLYSGSSRNSGRNQDEIYIGQAVESLIDAVNQSSFVSDKRINQILCAALFRVGVILGESL